MESSEEAKKGPQGALKSQRWRGWLEVAGILAKGSEDIKIEQSYAYVAYSLHRLCKWHGMET